MILGCYCYDGSDHCGCEKRRRKFLRDILFVLLLLSIMIAAVIIGQPLKE